LYYVLDGEFDARLLDRSDFIDFIGIPSDVKGSNYDLFRNYPDINISDLPTDMPLELRARFRILLPYTSINAAVENLAHASRDSSGNLIYHSPVQNRPWEWTEFLGESASDTKDGDDDLKIDIKNTASLSLELFGTRVTGERIIQSSAISGKAERDIRSLRSDMSTESVFKRDWRESRLHFDVAGLGNSTGGAPGDERNEGDETITGYSSVPLRLQTRTDAQSGSLGVSPASSVRSRLSASSFRSPTRSQSTARHIGSGDIIDVDSLSMPTSTSRPQKRKAMDPIQEDDEIQIIDNPDPGSSSRSQKKPKIKAASKTRSKKR
jgi:mediator of RNA polymerase II transcription subunit 12